MKTKWGVFDQPWTQPRGSVHVAPSTEQGLLQRGHELNPSCPCQPRQEGTSALWIHHES